MLTFIIGMMVGGIVGFFAFCLLTAGKGSDGYADYEENKKYEDAEYTQNSKGSIEVKTDESK